MSTYPTSPRSAFLEWCQAHDDVFVANAAAIGLTPAQASAFAGDTDKAVSANLAQEKAKQAALVATQVIDGCIDTLKTTAGDTIRTIRAFAEQSADPLNVYNIAQIPPPATPTPAPPPAQPSDLTVLLNPSMGTLTLRWKATNPAGTSGTSYIIRRKLPTETAFQFVGVSGKKEFVDGTFLAGPDSVQYTVQGQRSDSSGPVSEIFTVNFGNLPGIGMAASVSGGGINAADVALVDAIVKSQPHNNGKRVLARS